MTRSAPVSRGFDPKLPSLTLSDATPELDDERRAAIPCCDNLYAKTDVGRQFNVAKYTVHRFRKDFANPGRCTWPTRVYAWFMRDLRAPAVESQMAEATAAALQLFDRIIGELSPDERAEPRSISESRVREIAQGADVTPDDVSGFVHAFDYFARTAKDRARQRAEEWAIDISIHVTPVLLLAALAWLVWHLLRSF